MGNMPEYKVWRLEKMKNFDIGQKTGKAYVNRQGSRKTDHQKAELTLGSWVLAYVLPLLVSDTLLLTIFNG